jgi:predicted ATP-dependent endonuclease of OLD family
MILKALKLKNFRGYKDEKVDFDDSMNVVIGRNDVGKSTILDALNIFFNDEVKAEISDCNITSQDKIIEITCIFEVENETIIIDTTNPTTLSDEHLLNQDGVLELTKRINASGNSITKASTSVIIRAFYPEIEEKPLITFNQSSLKAKLNTYKDEIRNYENINKTKKADMRSAIFKHLLNDETVYSTHEILIKDIQDDGLKTWDNLKKSLPLFTLFESDRSNTDSDKEVQDPMKAITKEVLRNLDEELEGIKAEVVKKVEAIGAETIERLKEFDARIADSLKTVPKVGDWNTLFKFSLDTDDSIPLNKRGSGIRRLILLSYFRAQAEKKAHADGDKRIIYAIEEPETSQHPDFQNMIIESLISISEKPNHQVFLTTHTPEIAKIVSKESLIMIKKNDDGYPEIITDEDMKINEVVKSLGILPTIHSKVVVCVEGKHDINFLIGLNNSVPELKEIVDLESDDIRLMDVKGSNLVNWINENHFRDSGIKEFHLYDGDIVKYVDKVNEMNEVNDGRRVGLTTQYREMENYIPIEILENHFKCDLSEYRANWSTFNVPDYFKSREMLQIEDVKDRENAIKGILNKGLSRKITKELLEAHGVYEEVENWFMSIKNCID